MPTLILLSGLPFSGKSHAGRIWLRTGEPQESPSTPSNSSAGSTAETACPSRSGRPLCSRDTRWWSWTTPLRFRWMRDVFRDLARGADARAVLVHLDPPDYLLRERMAANEHSGERRGIAPGVLAEHLATFEAPGEDEQAIV